MENKEEDEAVRRERLKHYWDYRNVIATAYREGFISSLRKAQRKAESAGGMSVKLNGSEPELSVEMLAHITELTEKYVSEVIQKEQRKI
jgi:CTP:molybdopterin cytidylyltransferase MocA